MSSTTVIHYLESIFIKINENHYFRMVKYSKLSHASCFPVSLSGFLNLASEEVELCEEWGKENENYIKILIKNYQYLFNACDTSCILYQYEGQTNSRLGTAENTSMINFDYNFPSNEIQVFEEYLMFGINDLIGTVGGHSGLFIGFSFFGFISTILDYIKNKF